MKIQRINLYHVSLPFLSAFSHSIRRGISAENIIVEILADGGGVTGYGEGAPRPYVTGETQESSIESVGLLLSRPDFPWDLEDITQVWRFIDGLPEERRHNASLCALESSLLDFVGKLEGKSIVEYFPRDNFTDTIFYGAAIPLDERSRIIEIARFIQGLGISRIKLKVGRDLHENLETTKTVVDIFGGSCDIKLDVNGAWDRELALKHVPLVEEYNIKVVEQPMKPGDHGLAEFSRNVKELGVRIMADESVCTLGDAKRILAEGYYDMVNIRLSKCGGFQRSLEIIGYLREQGIPFQIACQLGESGLLSAAGRALSLLCKDSLYYDGSYDRFLLKENITTEDVSFGPGGIAGPLGGTGLGVRVSQKNLRNVTLSSVTFTNPHGH
ncbi:MAG: hypothetical protein JRJ29_11430 [Deltaproteobacteria bacterium]|nr:hypothetical protein [Deltaproteobacteria bacterium]